MSGVVCALSSGHYEGLFKALAECEGFNKSAFMAEMLLCNGAEDEIIEFHH